MTAALLFHTEGKGEKFSFFETLYNKDIYLNNILTISILQHVLLCQEPNIMILCILL